MENAEFMTTIKDIAQRLGVAPSTVSMALKDSPEIGRETKEAIRRAAREMNYVPNPFGRALQSRRSSLVGYLTSRVTDSFFDQLLQGAGETAVKHGYGLLTGVVSNGDELKSQLEIFREMRLEGMVVTLPGLISPKTLALLDKSGIPPVFCSGRGGPNHTFVMCDDIRGGELAAEHLISRGHRRLACQKRDEQRLAGNRNAIRKHRLPDPLLFGTADELAELLGKHPDVTAVTAYSDNEAILLHNAIRKLGLRIPEDVALVGYDDLWFAELENFRFTTVAQPKREMGRQAMEVLFELAGGGTPGPRLLAPELIVRESA